MKQLSLPTARAMAPLSASEPVRAFAAAALYHSYGTYRMGPD